MRGGALFLCLLAGVWELVEELDSYVWEGVCGRYMFCCVVRGECLTDEGGGGFGDFDYGFGVVVSGFGDVDCGFGDVVGGFGDGEGIFYGIIYEFYCVWNGVGGVGNGVGVVVDRNFGLK